MAVIQGQFGRATTQGADHGDVDTTKEGAQDQRLVGAREVGRSCGARSRGREGAATCGAVNEAPSYPAEPLG